jgi:O-antigen/teichoic acid export membrane protein
MERVGQVSKNASALVFAKLVTSVLAFLLVIVINKQLGAVYAGVYAYAYTLYAMFQVIPDFGIGNITIRDVSQDHPKVRRYFPNVVKLRVMLALGAFTLIMITSGVSTLVQHSDPLAGPRFWVVLAISFLLLVEQPFSNTLAENFIGLERLTTVALVYFIMGILRIGISFYIVGAVGRHPTQAVAVRALVLLMLTYIVTMIYSIVHFYILYRRALGQLDYPKATARDKAFAEVAMTHSPGTGNIGNALVANYSFTGISSPPMSVSTVFTPADLVEPEEIPLEWRSHIARIPGAGNVHARRQKAVDSARAAARLAEPSTPTATPAPSLPVPDRPAAKPPEAKPPSAPPPAVETPWDAPVRVAPKSWPMQSPGTAAPVRKTSPQAGAPSSGPPQAGSYLRKGRSKSAVRPDLRSNKSLRRYLLASAWPLAVVSAGIAIYAGLDIPILTWIKGPEAAGLYNAGAMFAKSIAFLTLALNMAVLPAVSVVGGKHPERLGEIWEKLLRYSLVFTVPMAVLVPIFARPILIFEKGTRGALFISAWPVVWLSMAAMCFTVMTAISFPFFIVIDKQKKITKVILISLVFKVVLNVALIPFLSYNGSAIAMLISEVAVFGIGYSLLSAELRHRVPILKRAAVPLTVMAALYVAAFGLQKVLVSGKVFAHAALGALQYAVLIGGILIVLYVIIAIASKMMSRSGLNELNELLKVE